MTFNAFTIAQLTVSFFSLASVRQAGKHQLKAWPLLFVGHAAFLVYSAITDQWGFWPLNVGMMYYAVKNFRLWRIVGVDPNLRAHARTAAQAYLDEREQPPASA